PTASGRSSKRIIASPHRLNAERLFQLLLQQPFVQFLGGIGPVPAVMADARVLRVPGRASDGLERLDHDARGFNLDRRISIAVETPAGDMRDQGGMIGVTSAADGYDGRPHLRM